MASGKKLRTNCTVFLTGVTGFLGGAFLSQLLDNAFDGEVVCLVRAEDQESAEERAVLRERGGIPIGVGSGTTVKRAILDKNVRIGRNVTIVNKDHVEEADRPELGFYIRNGIVVVVKNGTIADGTVI